MIQVDEQELLKRDAKCIEKSEVYKDYVFALEIYRNKYDRFLAVAKMEIRKTLAERISEAELERITLASDGWKEIQDKLTSFLEDAGKAKIEYLSAAQSYEAMRSALSSRKTELGRGL